MVKGERQRWRWRQESGEVVGFGCGEGDRGERERLKEGLRGKGIGTKWW